MVPDLPMPRIEEAVPARLDCNALDHRIEARQVRGHERGGSERAGSKAEPIVGATDYHDYSSFLCKKHGVFARDAARVNRANPGLGRRTRLHPLRAGK